MFLGHNGPSISPSPIETCRSYRAWGCILGGLVAINMALLKELLNKPQTETPCKEQQCSGSTNFQECLRAGFAGAADD